MKRSSIFWGLVFILLGGLFLLNNFGVITVDLWKVIWPLLLILLGGWVLWMNLFDGEESLESEAISIPLEGASEATLKLKHGAGQLRLATGASPDQLLSGSFAGGVTHRVNRRGSLLEVTLEVPHGGFPYVIFPWIWGRQGGIRWDLALNPEVPLSLQVEGGASDANFDLTELQVKDLVLETGASSTEVDLPAHTDHTHVKVDAGVASVVLRVPEGVAAHINVEGGLLDTQIDTERFPRINGGYQSSDYDSAAQRIDIDIDAGVGSVQVN
jgi:hypothetical protein